MLIFDSLSALVQFTVMMSMGGLALGFLLSLIRSK